VAALGREMRRTRGETYGLGGLDEPIVPGLWEVFHPVLAPLLESEDDPALWERTLSSVLGDLVTFYGEPSKKQVMLADVGRCSRWLRPHQSRVMLGGGFASPFGYGNKGGGYSFHSLPEFDWYRTWRRDPQKQCWEPIAGHPGFPRARGGMTKLASILSGHLEHREIPAQRPRSSTSSAESVVGGSASLTGFKSLRSSNLTRPYERAEPPREAHILKRASSCEEHK
jgi:hypothetical protein